MPETASSVLDNQPAYTSSTSTMKTTDGTQIPKNLTAIQAAALSAAANGIVITDADGFVIWANPAMTRLTGYQLDELIGQKTSILSSGEHDQKFYQQMWDTISAGEVWRGNMVNRRKDGSHYHEEMTITPVRNDQDEITHFQAIDQLRARPFLLV